MGERRKLPPRRAESDTHGANSRDRVTPFRPRRTPHFSQEPHPPGVTGRVMQPGGVGVDLRAGRTSLPPIPGRSRGTEAPSSEPGPAAVYVPHTAAMPPLTAAAQSRRPSESYPGYPNPTRGRQHRHRRSRRIALLALICAQVLVAATALWALTTPHFQARRVEVAGIADPLVVRHIETLPLTGCNIFRCDTAALAERVERLPAVASATVSAVYPDGLLVRVTPRQPELLWHTAQADLVIAADGTLLGAVSDDPAFARLTLPEVQDGSAAAFSGAAPAAGARLDPLLVNMAAQLRKEMQPVLGGGWALDYDAGTGLVAVHSGDGSRVVFGAPRDAAQAADDTSSVAALLNAPTADQVARGVRMQLSELRAMLALLAGQGQHAALIDLRWGTHLYYRLAS